MDTSLSSYDFLYMIAFFFNSFSISFRSIFDVLHPCVKLPSLPARTWLSFCLFINSPLHEIGSLSCSTHGWRTPFNLLIVCLSFPPEPLVVCVIPAFTLLTVGIVPVLCFHESKITFRLVFAAHAALSHSFFMHCYHHPLLGPIYAAAHICISLRLLD